MTFNEIWEKVQQDIQMSQIEAQELYSLAGSKEGTFVEIGTWKGGSVRIIRAAKEGTESKIFTVDNYRTDIFSDVKGGRTAEEEVAKVLGNTGIQMLVGNSDACAIAWQWGPIDFLFIDGDHSWEGATADIKAWLPHVVKGGIILFHDYDSILGVTKAIHDAIEEKLIEPIKKVGSLLITIKS